VYRQILINGKLQLEGEVKTADWEKTIKEVRVCIGL